jgi:hypothetical protein
VTDDIGDGHHVSGGILAATASAIGGALSAMPHTRLEISSEVTFEGDAFGFEIYPDGAAPEGGKDFLVGGNIWLPVEQAREFVAAIGAAMERRGLRYQLELAIEQDVSATEMTKHAEYDAMMAARTQS